MKKSTLNITAGTDVVLNDTLTFQGEVFDPSLSVNVEANLISGLGKRSALSFEIEDTHMIIDVPWEEGRLTGCYGLEVRGVTNGRKWATYSDSLIRYTKATEDGASSVTDDGDVYDITQTVAYRYSVSPIEEITADTDGLTGTPSVSVDYNGKDIAFHFDGIKGEKGDAFTYDDFTPEELESLRGPQGPKGKDGVVLDPEAVTIFDDISDLEGKTTAQKEDMIPDGNVVEEIIENADVRVDVIAKYDTPVLTAACSISYKTYKVSAGMKIYDEDIIVTKLIFNENISTAETDTSITYYVALPNTSSLGTANTATILAGKNYADVNIEVPAGKLIYVANKQVVSGGASSLTGCLVAIHNTDSTRGKCYAISQFNNVNILYGGFSYEITNSIPIKDYVDRMDDTINERIDEYHNGRVGFDDAKTVCVFGSSLTDQRFAPAGHIWLEEINHLCDANLVNFAYSGHNLKNNLDNFIAFTKRFDWVLFNNEANGTPYGLSGYIQLKNAKEITEEKGAYMLIGGENGTADSNVKLKDVDKCFDIFAQENCIPRSELRRELVSTGQTYRGFDSGVHGGWRTQSPFITKHLELLCSLPIMKSMKLFKLRPSSSEKTIVELTYDTPYERNENFYGISTGVANGGSFSDKPFYAVDNIDNASYDADADTTRQTVRTRETDTFKAGGAITVNEGTALLEIITDKIKISKGVLTFVCSQEPTLYVANCHSASTSYTDTPRSTWVEVTDKTYEDNVVTCNLSGDISLADKVRVLVVVGVSFTMSKPIFTDYDGKEKKLPENTYKPRRYGTECNDDLYMATGWTLGGNAEVKQVPSAIGLYAAGKSHVELPDNDSTAEKTIAIPAGTRKVAVRVMAQKFYKIMTKRFAGGDYADSEYVSSEQIINNYDNDLGLIDVIIDNSAVSRHVVCPGFAWTYVEYSPDFSATTLKVEIKRRDADEVPIMLYQVSVQVIE